MGKRIKDAKGKVDADKEYELEKAVGLLKENATAKFDETLDIAVRLGVDPKHADQMVRATVVLPNGTGKDIKVAVFAKGDKAKEAKDAGADIVGDDDLAEKIKKGEINFDRCIATPDMMAKVGAVGRILGPKGLMPNPKLGTVTTDVKKAVKDAKGGQVEFRVEKEGNVHAGIGKMSFDEKKLEENIQAFMVAINNAKPSGAKGVYLRSVSLSSTMGPAVKVDIASFAKKAA